MAKYSQISEAMKIFIKHEDDFLEADHDILYGPRLDTHFTNEERKQLTNLGWHKSEEHDCWIKFL